MTTRPILAATLLVLAACSDDGGAASAGAGDLYSSSGWGTIHAGPRNSDASPFPGPDDLRFAFQAIEGRAVGAAATVGPDGTVYVGVGFGSDGSSCFLFAVDGTTGEEAWCSDLLNDRAVTSSPLIDGDGHVFHGDNRAMHSFTAGGELRWSTPVVGFPISAQFTGDGHLLFMTHIGRIRVLDRATGGDVTPVVETIPGATYEPRPLDYAECLVGSTESSCFAANTPAIDLASGRFYFSLFEPGSTQAALVAMRYVGGDAPRIEPVWRNESLEGGTSSSPVISADGTRLYVADQAQNLLALDAATGAILWTFPLGFSPLGSLSVSPGGRIVPTGGIDGGAVMAIQDDGPSARILWEIPGITSRSITAQASNDRGYLAGVRPPAFLSLEMFTIDLATGTVLDAEPFPESGAVTVGTSFDRSGRVYVVLLGNGLVGFEPAP